MTLERFLLRTLCLGAYDLRGVIGAFLASYVYSCGQWGPKIRWPSTHPWKDGDEAFPQKNHTFDTIGDGQCSLTLGRSLPIFNLIDLEDSFIYLVFSFELLYSH